MPYVTQNRKEQIQDQLHALSRKLQEIEAGDGDLNYVISTLLTEVLTLDVCPRYTKINTALGVLACVQQELYRRIAAPYEDHKIKDNGDIGPFATFRGTMARREVEKLNRNE